MNPEELGNIMLGVVSTGSFPSNASTLSSAIVGYIQSKGKPKSPTISYTLLPATGAGWANLIPIAISSKGIASSIVPIALTTEFASSTKVVPAPHGTQTLPMSFNSGAKVKDLSEITTAKDAWIEIAKAIIDYVKPEIS